MLISGMTIIAASLLVTSSIDAVAAQNKDDVIAASAFDTNSGKSTVSHVLHLGTSWVAIVRPYRNVN